MVKLKELMLNHIKLSFEESNEKYRTSPVNILHYLKLFTDPPNFMITNVSKIFFTIINKILSSNKITSNLSYHENTSYQSFTI